MLAEARTRILRYTPTEAATGGDILRVDLRWQDERDRTESCDPELAGRRLVLVCQEGHSSSLAAASLVALGVDAGDLISGYDGWVAVGLPTE